MIEKKCNYDRDKYDQAYSEIENFYILHSECNFYVFDLSKQKDQIASQPIRLELKFNAAFGVADCIAYALVLTRKLISISSDGQRHFDLL